MRISLRKISFFAAVLITVSSCTQPPAQVDLKGQNTYGRDGVSYASNTYTGAPVINSNDVSTSQSATVTSIGVSDLSAPTPIKTASNPPPSYNNSPFQQAHPETLKPAAGGDVNLWTGKPHASDMADNQDQSFNIRPQGQQPAAGKEQMVSDVTKPANAAPVTALDNIVGNDGTKKTTVAITKPAKTVVASSGGTFMWPVSSKKVISEFGPKGKGKVNDGINIASADGEPVWASADGEVVYVGNELEGYGNMVLIKHAGDKATTYAHLSRATVEKYDRVKQGDIIGYVGTTGNVKEPQLHFAIRDGKDAVDPLKYLDRKVASLP